MRAVDGNLHQTRAGFAGHFQLRNLFLHFLHFFLHLLGLLHQIAQTAFSKHKLSLLMVHNRKPGLRSNGADTLFIQLGVKEPTQRLNVIIRDN